MNTDDFILVSVDDHVVEPRDLFQGHLSGRALETAPKIVVTPDGTEVWEYYGQIQPNIGLNAVAGRPKAEYGMEPTNYDEIRAGCYDVHQRVLDMSANGVLGSLNFPSFPRFCGQYFWSNPDKDMARQHVQAYNDWHVDTWCAAAPERFIPCAIPVAWDPELAAAEVRRMAGKGVHALTFSENPSHLDLPSLHSDHWDPLWTACADTETVVCMHIGSSSKMVVTAPDAPIDVLITLTPVNLVQCAADLVWSPLFRKFPTLKVALSEGGIGWIPYFLERLDYVYQQHRAWTGQDFGDRLPSDVFNEHVITCFITDALGIEMRHHLNLDAITWECDYPHSDSTWPTSPEHFAKQIDGLPDDEVDKISHLNAMRLFHYDPFSTRPRERCTVGALRAEVAGHDVAEHARGGPREGKAVTSAALETLEREKHL